MPPTKSLLLPEAPVGRIQLAEPVPEAAPEPPRHIWGRVVWFWMLIWVWCLHNSAWFISGVLHLGMIVVLADTILEQQSQERTVGIDAILADKHEAENFETILEKPASEPSGEPLTQPVPVIAATEDVLPQDLVSGARAATAAATTGQGGTGGGDGTGEGGPGIPFFGTHAAGDSFVYVVDMSGSMQGARFRRAIVELNRSIVKLKSEQKFFVIFFNDQAFPMFYPRPERGLVAASATMKGKANRWIRSRIPTSVTNAIPALEMALQLKPDAIFFLTDGELPDAADVQEMLHRRNTERVVIHTIAFENADGEGTLQAIAKDNGGTYRFVK